MTSNQLGNQLDLIDKSKIRLIIGHKENRTILKEYLKKDYKVLLKDFNYKDEESEKADMLIVDEKGFKKYKEKIFKIKKSNISLYQPLLLITSTSSENIPDDFLQIIDEIVQVPIKKNILYSRIQNLLNVRSLFLSTQIYQNLTEENPVGICILFKNKEIKYVNNSFLEIIDKNRKNVLNKNISEFFPKKIVNKHIKSDLENNENKFNFKLKRDQDEIWVDIHLSKMKFKNIKLKLLIVVDVTEQKKTEEEIRYLRFHDQLTGLYNRDYFMEEIKRLDTKRQLPLTLIMVDINSLKLINDVYGHDRGDFLIKNASEILENNLRDEDILARIGGDEFAIILPDTSKAKGKEIINRINKKCKEFDEKGIIISLALGLATKEKTGQDVEEIFKIADDRMYKNKTTKSKKVREKIISNIKYNLKEKTNESKEHLTEMKNIAAKFSEKLNLDSSQKNKLLLLAETHDIGKVSLSTEFFQKDKKLTKSECKKLEEHTDYGYRICRSIPKLNSIAEEILSHHERWDGKGYPKGLKGQGIPYLARIIAIIDNYLFLKESNNQKEDTIIEKIKEKAGNELDPQLTKIFIDMLN
ncbi:MAG TPA: diguanylate cyclase [Halanaerobiales bacterium]|nr:diguanylate cyclase [Halanaerobiales bacterium]